MKILFRVSLALVFISTSVFSGNKEAIDINSLSDADFDTLMIKAQSKLNPRTDPTYKAILSKDLYSLSERELEFRKIMKSREHTKIKSNRTAKTAILVATVIAIVGFSFLGIIKAFSAIS